MGAGWILLLMTASFLLFKRAELGSSGYWGTVFAVASGWMVFLMIFTPLRHLAKRGVTGESIDKILLGLLLLLFLTTALAMLLGSLLSGNYGTAVLFALVSLGIFNILGEMGKRGGERKRRKEKES